MAFMAAAPWIASAAGSIIGGLLGRKGQKDANETNVNLSREQMAFQERMAGSQHQREVADLKAAGLNPMLSGTGGAGAASPSGALATVQNEEESLGRGVSSAGGAFQQKLANDYLRAQTNQADNSAALNDAQRYLVNQQRRQIEEVMPYVVSNARGVSEGQGITNLMNMESLSGMKVEGEIDRSQLGTVLRYLNRIIGTGSSAASMISPVKSLFTPGSGVRRR